MLRASDQINKIITIEAIMVIKKEFLWSHLKPSPHHKHAKQQNKMNNISNMQCSVTAVSSVESVMKLDVRSYEDLP